MASTAAEVWQLLGELVNSQKETERIMKEQSQETDRRFQQTDRQIEKMSQEVKRVSQQVGAITGKWGAFVENMVAPACETLFLNRGIPVHQVSQRVKRRLGGDTLEIDVLVTNENHVLIVEVKSTLKVQDINDFMEDLSQFKQFFPEYSHKQLYGAVAGIDIEDGADKYATRQGLFVLIQSGETMTIFNKAQFEPKIW